MGNKVIYISILIIVFAISSFFLRNVEKEKKAEPVYKQVPLWDFRSVDTVKYSRDLAAQMIDNPQFDMTIEKQVLDIASLGVSHIAISTPYDSQFSPFLNRWVKAAREHNLKVWFRGNFSGWEKWFSYQKIDREEHKKLLKEFIESNAGLFEDGDIFTSCPECENGGPGDPRDSRDVEGFRKFLVDEYNISKDAFDKIGKKVQPGFYSMNYDVASLVMDEATTNSLGDLVVIDHYTKDPKKLAEDVKKIAGHARGKVVLGEFGAPIPDIHGNFTEDQQSQWIEKALQGIENTPEVVGVNYWTNVGGSTGLWNESGSSRKAVDIIKKFYNSTKTIQVQ